MEQHLLHLRTQVYPTIEGYVGNVDISKMSDATQRVMTEWRTEIYRLLDINRYKIQQYFLRRQDLDREVDFSRRLQICLFLDEVYREILASSLVSQYEQFSAFCLK